MLAFSSSEKKKLCLVIQFIQHFTTLGKCTNPLLEESITGSIPSPSQESLYGFIGERYCVPEVAGPATHDFLSALEQHYEGHKVRQQHHHA